MLARPALSFRRTSAARPVRPAGSCDDGPWKPGQPVKLYRRVKVSWRRRSKQDDAPREGSSARPLMNSHSLRNWQGFAMVFDSASQPYRAIPETSAGIVRSAALPSGLFLQQIEGTVRYPWTRVAGDRFLIGTAARCQLQLPDPDLPGVHCVLIPTEEAVFIEQIAAAPPLMINGRAVLSAILAGGDRIQIGPIQFAVHLVQATEEIAEPIAAAQQCDPQPVVMPAQETVAEAVPAQGIESPVVERIWGAEVPATPDEIAGLSALELVEFIEEAQAEIDQFEQGRQTGAAALLAELNRRGASQQAAPPASAEPDSAEPLFTPTIISRPGFAPLEMTPADLHGRHWRLDGPEVRTAEVASPRQPQPVRVSSPAEDLLRPMAFETESIAMSEAMCDLIGASAEDVSPAGSISTVPGGPHLGKTRIPVYQIDADPRFSGPIAEENPANRMERLLGQLDQLQQQLVQISPAPLAGVLQGLDLPYSEMVRQTADISEQSQQILEQIDSVLTEIDLLRSSPIGTDASLVADRATSDRGAAADYPILKIRASA